MKFSHLMMMMTMMMIGGNKTVSNLLKHKMTSKIPKGTLKHYHNRVDKAFGRHK